MKFIHAVVFDKDEFNNGLYDTGSWDNLTEGDYVVHCLYDVDNEFIIIHEDNCHAPVEAMIETFLEGFEYTNAVHVDGMLIKQDIAKVTKAFVVVDNGCSYGSAAVKEKLIAGNYGEVL